MLRAAIGFFVLGLFAMILGMNGVAGLSIEFGRILLIAFVALAVISLVVGLMGGRSRGILPALIAASVLAGNGASSSFADENIGEKVEGEVRDTSVDAKKSVRKAKRHQRKRQGTDTVGKDAKDAMDDASDSVEAGAKKAKNKID
jgi:uncharacterized membrane protein YtjA (UPF0391 family)